LILGVPGGAVEVIALLLNGYMGHITNQRLLCSLGGLVSALVGIILIVALPESNNVGRLIGYYMTQASPTAFVALLSMISSNVAGYTKKTTVAALYLIGYCVGNIIGECRARWSPILCTFCTFEKRRCADCGVDYY
jgi:ACS family allantoate permease-like MFS transporter